MRLIDIAGSEMRSGRNPLPYAQSYWAGESTERPIWELLVTCATVIKIICDDQDLRRARLVRGKRLPRS